ncbi:helix-turn-helix domain-containing protein [Pyrobaculum sp. 3827-6]|uniref:helix-turn-helix domain-containing protein n=1 Tax=Pyrobaculum sp. 3827-6 TaxID=2983604 RepID=UPI0021D84488|nr:helix-turn-helix domain-containing protein [Pyrobaculum sp. 3827-6]MCU7788217.1 helix-turn-helix domain-containing protein [Pyrobaculum sp. 3827-6]
MPRTPGRLCCEKLREAAVRLLERGLSAEEVAAVLGVSERSVRRWASGKAVVAMEKSVNMQRAERGGAAGRREAAERPGAPPVDNVWVAILRKRLNSSAADENAG